MSKSNGGVAGKSENSLVQVFERTVSKAVEVFLLGSIFTLTSFTGPRRINPTPDKAVYLQYEEVAQTMAKRGVHYAVMYALFVGSYETLNIIRERRELSHYLTGAALAGFVSGTFDPKRLKFHIPKAGFFMTRMTVFMALGVAVYGVDKELSDPRNMNDDSNVYQKLSRYFSTRASTK